MQAAPTTDDRTNRRPTGDSTSITEYYTEAGADYAAWSPRWNMHFGFPRSVTDVVDRERMLENMNDAVLDRVLAVPRRLDCDFRVVDLGCGLGATMRRGATRHPGVRFDGCTIVDWQVERGRDLNEADPNATLVTIRKADYLDLPFADRSVQGAYAVESSCYAPGESKEALVAEAARVLEPGARFVVADGFRIDGGRALSSVGRRFYDMLCDSWAIDELADRDAFVDALRRHGFDQIEVEDLSLRVAWSVLHVPFVTLAFFWRCWRQGDVVAGWRAANVIGSLLTMILGLMRWRFRYLLITARRTDRASRPTLNSLPLV